VTTNRFSRQSFLGPRSQEFIARCTVGVTGLGGGGSHVVQQLAHIGFQRYVIYDGDSAEDSNLNRLVGATNIDVAAETPKLHLAKVMIYGLQPGAEVQGFPCRWQDRPEALRECQVVFGCVDSYIGRHELEVACRRYLAHLIDIGMDVHGDDKPTIGGQVIWPNGVLASAAVGLGVEVVTGWTGRKRRYEYLVYDGNDGTLVRSPMLRGHGGTLCPHHVVSDVGDPVLLQL
jgi:molybdopterin-synthase adenylyltransferase